MHTWQRPRTRTGWSWCVTKCGRLWSWAGGWSSPGAGSGRAWQICLREQEIQELQQHRVQLLLDKNQAKQEVICKLSEKVTQDFMKAPEEADRDFLSQQEKMEHLKAGRGLWALGEDDRS